MTDRGSVIAARYDIVRSAHWKRVEIAHLARQPVCVACRHPGARNAVHHIFPFHICVALGRADLELDERNLVTLCAESDAPAAGDHHLVIGHFDDYESMNLKARHEAEHQFHGMSGVQLRASALWSKLASERPPHFAAMKEHARRELRALIDATFPLLEVQTMSTRTEAMSAMCEGVVSVWRDHVSACGSVVS